MRLKQFKLTAGSDIFKAFSDESRIRILNLLFNNQELCISDMEHILDFTQTKTSRHVTYLKNASILNVKKVDHWTFYFIKDEVSDFVGQLLKYVERDAQLQKDMEVYKTLKSNRELSHFKIRNRS